ncbi:hypothetical protein LSH36_1192g00039 [Paralvinella palmiformis]|uniref:AP-2 complex subunit alpha n=1 Tax=Paralvinella palmiformis TaxID=53620 RepID=A0AAD9IVD8_9ANNE|nr:hypothetical protein LSH36_1192g00039 [Paralvinella palmiformis]
MPAVKGDGMRGLAVFISDIRNCKSKEQEVKRINKELANIRSKFKEARCWTVVVICDKEKPDRCLTNLVRTVLIIVSDGEAHDSGRLKAHFVCQNCNRFGQSFEEYFIGSNQGQSIVIANTSVVDQGVFSGTASVVILDLGYLFISVLVSATSDLMKLVIMSVKNDLTSRNPVHINLALQCIANIGSREMADAFGNDIPKLLVSGDTIDSVKQSAALCLLKLIRSSADIFTVLYTDLQDYTYYFVPAPWLSVKLLRLLQNYPPPDDATVKNRLSECLETILNKAQEPPKSKKVQHSNARNAVLFEAINLIIHADAEPNLLVRACNQLGQFLQHRETNLRYLALESMCLLATSEFSHEAVKKHQETVITALKTERDVSVRQRAVDLLYAMCDRSNAEEIVSEMLSYLETADYSIREEMVLKVAILAEKYAVDYTWYVDTILNLIRIAGDYVSEEVWYRVIQIVINREDVQGYAAKTVFEALQAPACHENMVKVGGYILGEFGNLIAGDPRSRLVGNDSSNMVLGRQWDLERGEDSPVVQFQLLHSKFHLCSVPTRQLLLSTYIKFINLFPEMKQQITEVLHNENSVRNADVELQQRAVEYLQLSNVASTDVLATVLEEMPPFPERESSILAKLKKKRPDKLKHSMEPKEYKLSNAVVSSETTNAVPSVNSPSKTAVPNLLSLSGSSQSASNPAPVSNTGILIDVLGGLGGELSTDGPVSQPAASTAAPATNGLAAIGVPPVANPLLDTSASLLGVEDKSTKYLGVQQKISSKLPVTINKFIEPTDMDAQTFFMRWKILNSANQECQKIVTAKQTMDTEDVKKRLLGFGVGLLEGVDPNLENMVSAGIVHTRSSQIGILLRLEPNKQANLYRLTIRSSKADMATVLVNLLEHQL